MNEEEMVITLQKMEAIFRERDNDKVGAIMTILFPDGVKLDGPNDFVAFHLFDWIVGNLTRFAVSDLTHEDSIFDLAVYATMLATFSRMENKSNNEKE